MRTISAGDTVHIEGRRWFARTEGNTYFTASIWLNGDNVSVLPRQYGYGSQYEYEAMAELRRLGLLPADRERWATPPWQVAQDLGFKLVSTVVDVARRKDLHHL